VSDLDRISRRIAPDLAKVSRRTAAALAAAAALVGRPDAIPHGGPGKKLRPAVLLLVARLVDADPADAVSLAVTVELVHAASLIHDDVIDCASIRRGAPTVPALIGASDAVLLGDVIFTAAFRDVVSLNRPEYLRILAHAAGEVCAGEARQNRAKGNFRLTESQYLRIVDLKTASLYRACGALAAAAASSSKPVTAAAGAFARNLGLAFQLADDLLDVVGDPQKTGKASGCDLAEGKMTLPAILYLKKLPASRRRAALASLTRGDAASRDALVRCIARSRAVSETRRFARRYASAAVAELDSLPRSPEKTDLAALCRFAADRSY